MAANPTTDPTVTVTRFASKKVTSGSRTEQRWRQVCKTLAAPKSHQDRESLPLITFGTYPNDSRVAGSTPDAFTAVAGDYDAGVVPIERALEMLRAAGIAACVYTTRRHTADKPRYRVVVPLSRPVGAGAYPAMVSQLNGVLGGILANESWEPTRCYFYGKVVGSDYRCEQVDGACLDERMAAGDATWTPIQKSGASSRDTSDSQPVAGATAHAAEGDFARQVAVEGCTEATMGELESALACIPSDARETWIEVGVALASLKGTDHEDRARELWTDWSQTSERYQEGDEERWITLRADKATYKKVFALAQAAGWCNPRSRTEVLARDASRDPTVLDWIALPEDPPGVNFVIPGWMPDGVVTLLAAHGGTGKSYLSIYVALCLATGRHPFLTDESIPRKRVLLYSAEDSMPVLQSRIVLYMRRLSIQPSDVARWLCVLDATGSDNVLFTGHPNAPGRTTPRFEWLARRIATVGAEVLIYDNASDAIDANENERAKVRQFISALKRLAPAVLLLSHVDAVSSMADPASAKGYSGSTAWHNSVRSRWFMARSRDSDDVLLTLPKVNYAKSGVEVVIRWNDEDGVFAVESARAGPRDHRQVLLRLLSTAIDARIDVSPARVTPKSVFNTLKTMDGFPHGLNTGSVSAEVQRWRTEGLVAVESFTRSNRTHGERLVLTEAGRELCGEVCAEEAFL